MELYYSGMNLRTQIEFLWVIILGQFHKDILFQFSDYKTWDRVSGKSLDKYSIETFDFLINTMAEHRAVYKYAMAKRSVERTLVRYHFRLVEILLSKDKEAEPGGIEAAQKEDTRFVESIKLLLEYRGVIVNLKMKPEKNNPDFFLNSPEHRMKAAYALHRYVQQKLGGLTRILIGNEFLRTVLSMFYTDILDHELLKKIAAHFLGSVEGASTVIVKKNFDDERSALHKKFTDKRKDLEKNMVKNFYEENYGTEKEVILNKHHGYYRYAEDLMFCLYQQPSAEMRGKCALEAYGTAILPKDSSLVRNFVWKGKDIFDNCVSYENFIEGVANKFTVSAAKNMHPIEIFDISQS